MGLSYEAFADRNSNNGCDNADENSKTCEKNPNASTDTDNDGVLDVDDNCSLVSNPLQSDIDLDGLGDLCDQYSGGVVIYNPINGPPVILYYNDGPDSVSQNPFSYTYGKTLEFLPSSDCTVKNNVKACTAINSVSSGASSNNVSTVSNVVEFGEIFDIGIIQDPSVPFDFAIRQQNPSIPFEITVINQDPLKQFNLAYVNFLSGEFDFNLVQQDPSVPFDLVIIGLDDIPGVKGSKFTVGIDESLPFDLAATKIIDFDRNFAFEWGIDESLPFDLSTRGFLDGSIDIGIDYVNMMMYVDPSEPISLDSTASSFSQLVTIALSPIN